MVHNVSKITARLSQLSRARNGSQAVVDRFIPFENPLRKIIRI